MTSGAWIEWPTSLLTRIVLVIFYFFTRDSCTGRYCWQRVLAMAILSVCLSVCLSRPGTESSPGEIETPGLHRRVA